MADVVITLTGSGTWTLPSDWNDAVNTIQVYGAGGDGAAGTAARSGGGGAGGLRLLCTNVPLASLIAGGFVTDLAYNTRDTSSAAYNLAYLATGTRDGETFGQKLLGATGFNASGITGGAGSTADGTINNVKDSTNVIDRRLVSKAWNTANAVGTINNLKRIVTPFRAVNNLGDFLARKNYVCGGSNQVNKTFPGRQGHMGSIMSRCDGTGIPSATCNPRFVPDSSDYIRYKKLRSVNNNYNDKSFGGDQSHGSYVPLMRVRR